MVVVLPFWYLATAHRTVFNAAVIGCLAAGLVVLAVRRLASRAGRGARGLRGAVLPFLLRTGRAAAVLGLLYVGLWAFASAQPALGAAAAAALLLAVGLWAR